MPDRLIAIGGSLCAGAGDFTLSLARQQFSFPAQFARACGMDFHQPMFEAPGIATTSNGYVPPPAFQQSTVFRALPPPEPSNLGVPGMTTAGLLDLRPRQPLIDRKDPRQTILNLLLGTRRIAMRPESGEHRNQAVTLPGVVEYAAGTDPDQVIIETGFDECTAALNGNGRLPAAPEFSGLIGRIVTAFRCSVMLATVPNPLHTAAFFTVGQAAKTLRAEPEVLMDFYGIRPGDILSLGLVNEIAYQLFSQCTAPLQSRTIPAAVAEGVTSGIEGWNRAIRQWNGKACIADVAGVFERAGKEGWMIAGRRIGGGYLEGFFGYCGCTPGATGHALIANEFLRAASGAGKCRPLSIPLEAIAASDPVLLCEPASGGIWTLARVRALPRAPDKPPVPKLRAKPEQRLPAPIAYQLPAPGVLELELEPDTSFFGDAISALDSTDPNGVFFGTSGDIMFGGFAMVDSHLHGRLRFEFDSPDGNTARFRMSFGGGLIGEDAVLVCPAFFRMAFLGNRVDDVSGFVSEGSVDLSSGEISRLRVFANYASSALAALIAVNKGRFPSPLSFVSGDIASPLEWGSASARFEPRPGGGWDFTFFGTRYVPLRDGTRWPLNLCGPPEPSAPPSFATVPARGTVMHPHLRLSTKPCALGSPAGEIPQNVVRELTLHGKHTAFGDVFSLAIPELGGPATGRSHMLGRAIVQTGERSRNTIPVAVLNLPPGGMFTERESSPVADSFPGRLPPGPTGFYEMLRFPERTYALDELSLLDDPFDPSVGAIDVRTGALFDDTLHRGFIHQDLIYSLIRVEPRTPKSSFLFRGPAEVSAMEKLTLRFRGTVRVPYPKGLYFPQPNLSTAYLVGQDSALDPYLWLRAVEDEEVEPGFRLEGTLVNEESSMGERFHCRFGLPADPQRSPYWFQYENLSQEGEFRLHSIAWIGFGRSLMTNCTKDPVTGLPRARRVPGKPDTVTFAGFGWWRKDGKRGLHQVAAQICLSPGGRYAGIQIGAADVSNVNTKPRKEADALP